MARKGLFAALEDLDEGNEEVSIIDAGEDAHDENVVRDTTDELEMSATQIADLTGTIDQSTNTVDSLMAIGDELDKSTIPGVGIDEVAIKPTVIAVEALYRKLALESYAIPALEAFSNTRTRLEATKTLRASLEEKTEEAKSGIKKALEKAWEMIKKFFAKIYEAIKNIFGPNAKKMLERAKKLKENEPKNKEFKDATLFKAFGKPGEAKVSAADVKEAILAPSKFTGKSKLVILGHSLEHGDDGEVNDVDIWKDHKVPEDAHVEYCNKTDLVTILDAILKLDETLKHLEEKFNKEMGESKEDVEEKKAITKMFNIMLKLFSQLGKYGLDYCRKCLKELEGGKKEEDKGDEGKKD